MRRVCLALLALLCAAPLAAQTAVPTSLTVLVIPATGDPATVPAVPGGIVTVAISAASCNQPLVPAPTCHDAMSRVRVQSPFNAANQCVVTLPAVAFGTYRVTTFFSASCNGTACSSDRGTPAACFLNLPAQMLPPAPPTGAGLLP